MGRRPGAWVVAAGAANLAERSAPRKLAMSRIEIALPAPILLAGG
jgi:hypothetical protein